ncbi:MAG: HAMP domain-containing sensor histidine kinase [Bacilli bacterium]|nr:HAMP domain-containing sensor histidine kinase [Bacilli bacterium]MDD4547626.1 HAMP domain-containing sensor histidine kinase [Bacilli bacterium]
MFKKLRKDFVVVNMVIICALMLSTFVIVYIISYQNTMSDLKKQLLKLPRGNLKVMQQGYGYNNPNSDVFPGGILPIDYSLSFNLFINNHGELLRVNSYVDMSREMYQQAADTALKNQKEYGIISLDNRNWMYRVTSNIKFPHNGDQKFLTNDSYIIVFLDITKDIYSLNNLLLIFFTVGLLMLVGIYFISIYFAKRSIKGIEEAWNKQKQFIADASHEFKTPIAIIEANTDALLLETKSKNTKWIDYIKLETNRMNKLVTDLLYLAKAEDPEILLENSSFNISEVVNNIIRAHEVIIFEKNLQLKHDIESNINFTGDIDKIEQVLIVLIENAIKYTDAFGTINIKLWQDKKTINLLVSNTGKGIQKENLSKLFDRFYREDNSRTNSENSYGLGLSIAKTIIERMDGKIFVNSIPNKITEFRINFKIK